MKNVKPGRKKMEQIIAKNPAACNPERIQRSGALSQEKIHM